MTSMSGYQSFFVVREQASYGPYSLQQIEDLARKGELQASDSYSDGTQVWPDWAAFQPVLASQTLGTPPPVSRFTENDLVKASSRLRTAYLICLAVVAIPALLWSADSDNKRGVGMNPNARHAGTRKLLRENTGLLVPATIVSGIALIPAILLIRKRRQQVKVIRQSLTAQS